MTRVLGIRREDLSKIGEQRCAVAPEQALALAKQNVEILCQPAVHPQTEERKRAFDDHEYEAAGVTVSEDLSAAEIIFGLKEVDIAALLPAKTYLFFSHTHKGQPKNRPLLAAMIDAGITLIDYELISDHVSGRLLTQFTTFAGYAGLVDTLWTLGRRLAAEGIPSPFEELRQSVRETDLDGARTSLKRTGERIAAEGTPPEIPPIVVCVLGTGRSSHGTQELLSLLPNESITIDQLAERLENGNRHLLYTLVLEVDEMYRIKPIHSREKTRFEQMEAAARFNFYLGNPQYFESNMDTVLPYTTVLLNCIAWSGRYPRTIPTELMKQVWSRGTPLRVIGDITCDPNGSIEFSRETWIDRPVFTYHPDSGIQRDGLEASGISVMAVTNLPSEFPRDASEGFSRELEPLLPSLLDANLDGTLEESGLREELRRAVILWRGELTPEYRHLAEFVV